MVLFIVLKIKDSIYSSIFIFRQRIFVFMDKNTLFHINKRIKVLFYFFYKIFFFKQQNKNIEMLSFFIEYKYVVSNQKVKGKVFQLFNTFYCSRTLVTHTHIQVLCFNLRLPLKLFLFILRFVKTFVFSLSLELVFSLCID
jgi:hypothetical protein